MNTYKLSHSQHNWDTRKYVSKPLKNRHKFVRRLN